MILVVTEHNRWENEKWKYAFDISQQDCSALNLLMMFIRIANKKHEEVADEMRGARCFASSKYSMEFYDSMEIDEPNNSVKLKNSSKILGCRYCNDYTSSDWSLRLKISPRKILGARNAIRDKGENILYKSFTDCCFASSLQKH